MIYAHDPQSVLDLSMKGPGKKVSFNDETDYTMRVLPTDLDLLMHLNNGVYFSFMDFGRWDMIFRNGSFDLTNNNDWYTVVKAFEIQEQFVPDLSGDWAKFDEKFFY